MAHPNNRLRNTDMSGGHMQSVFRRTRLLLYMLLATLMIITFPVLAQAQSASFRSVDTNRDGVLSRNELVTRFGRAGANRLLRQLDRNGDTILTIQELRQRGDPQDRPTHNDQDRDDRDDDDGRGDDNGDNGDGDGDGDGDGGGGDGDGGDD